MMKTHGKSDVAAKKAKQINLKSSSSQKDHWKYDIKAF